MGLAPAGVDSQELTDIEEVELAVAVGVCRDNLISKEIDELADIKEVQIARRVVVRGARLDTVLECHGLDIDTCIEDANDLSCLWVQLMNHAVGSADIQHGIRVDHCGSIGIDLMCSGVFDAAFELIEEVDGAYCGTAECDAADVEGVCAEGHRVDQGTARGEELEVVLSDVGALSKGGTPADKEAAGIDTDGGDICASDLSCAAHFMGLWIDVCDFSGTICNDEFIAEPCHRVCITGDIERIADQIGIEIQGVDGAVVITEVEGILIDDHGADWAAAYASEADLPSDGVEHMDDALGTCEEDCLGLGGSCDRCSGKKSDESDIVFHFFYSPGVVHLRKYTCRGRLPFDTTIFVHWEPKAAPLFGGALDVCILKVLLSELWSGTADELGEEFASRGDLVVAIDREDMIVDGGFADIEMECDLFFGIACDQTIENLQPAAGERTERWFVGGGEISPDLVVDGHMDERDNALFAWGEISRANTLVQPECCAPTGDVGWADRDDVVVDAALSMDFVVGVRAVPCVLAPDLVAGENHCLAGEFRKIWIFGGSFDWDGLCVFSPSGFGLIGDPSCAVDAEEVGFGIAGHAEVFDFRVDDDLCPYELAQGCEEIVSPSVHTCTEIAALTCNLVALVDIFCGQFGEHWESPSEPWVGSLVLSVTEICPESQDVLWANEWLAIELGGRFVGVRAGELGVGGVFVECGDRAVRVDNVSEAFEGGCFHMPIAEDGIGFPTMSSIGRGTVFGGTVSPIGVVGVVGHQGRIEGVPVTGHGEQIGIAGAVVSVLGPNGIGFAGSGAHRVGEHERGRCVNRRCPDGEVDQPSSLCVVDKASVAEEQMVVPIGIVAGVVPFWDGWAQKNIRAINNTGVFVGLLDAWFGKRIETGSCTDDREPTRAVLRAVSERIDIPRFVRVSTWLGGDRNVFVGVGVELPTGRDLTHVRGADEGFGGLLCARQRGEQDPDQHCDDGNHDQQLDERESCSLGRDSGYSDRAIHRSHCSHPKRRSLHKHGKSGRHKRPTMPIQCMVPSIGSVIGPWGVGILEAA